MRNPLQQRRSPHHVHGEVDDTNLTPEDLDANLRELARLFLLAPTET